MDTKHLFAKDSRRLPSGMVNWLLFSMGCVVAPYSIHLSWWLFPLVGLLFAWRCFLEVRGHPLPSLWVRIILMIGLVLLVLIDQQTILGRDAGAAFLVGLLGVKLLELRTARDFVLVSFMCYFLIVGALLFSQTIFMCLYLAGGLFVITTALVRMHLAPEMKAAASRSFRLAFRLLLQSLPLALLLFIFIPRIQGKFAFQFHQLSMGLSESMQPGDIARLNSDNRIAFRAEILSSDPPKAANLYWKGFILWETDGIRWYLGRRPWSAAQEPPVTSRGLQQRITLMPHAQNWVFALDRPVRSPEGAILRPGQILESRFKLYHKWQYLVASDVQSRSQEMSSDIQYLTLQLPKKAEPRVAALASRWRQQTSDPEKIIAAALKFFHDEGFRYTLNPGRYSGNEPLSEFLFERKQGFCEHFASAFTFLMRQAGIPARLVVGYLGGEYNPYGRFFVVRQNNAHVWSEVWIASKGWLRVDPTAAISAERIDPALAARRAAAEAGLGAADVAERLHGARAWQPRWMRRSILTLQLYWGVCEDQWDRWVISYDAFAQENLLRHLGFKRLSWMVIAGFLVIMAAVTVGFIFSLLALRGKKPDPARQLFRRFCSKLASHGLAPHSGEGPLHFSRRAACRFPAEAAAMNEIGQRYVRLRYGKPEAGTESLRVLSRQIRRMRLRRGAPST
ncbi:MAG: DUF3488 domain-containing transglutaminase family protein [Verrucomicrobia bacterium]|nr:DUF3488 domain-containing transglutaminase family protein [Verrucomicrobiota bacterium]